MKKHTCDCGFTWRHGHSGAHSCDPYYRKTIAELRAAAAPQVVADERKKQDGIEAAELQTLLITEFECYRPTYPAGLMAWAKIALLDCSPHRAAAPVQEQEPVDGILATTIELARCIWRDNYKNEAPDWEPLTDLAGVLSQIDNMVCGMRRAAPVQPVAVPDGWKPIAPEICPITGRKFWGNIDHPERGLVATYGGPSDTYSIPYLSDDNELRVERFDQDAGDWVEGGEPCGWYSDEQPAAAPAAQGDAENLLATFIDNVSQTFGSSIYFKEQPLCPFDGWEQAFDIDKWLDAARAAVAAKAAS